MASKDLRGVFWYLTMGAWERTVQTNLSRPHAVCSSVMLP